MEGSFGLDSAKLDASGDGGDLAGSNSEDSPPLASPSGHIEHKEDNGPISILTFEQVKRIDSLMTEVLTLERVNGVQPIKTTLYELIMAVKNKLLEKSLTIRDIRLNGGAASQVLVPPESDSSSYLLDKYGCPASLFMPRPPGSIRSKMSCSYNDIDIVFGMEVDTPQDFHRIRLAVFDVILDLLPASLTLNQHPSSLRNLAEKYICKQFKYFEESKPSNSVEPNQPDRWSIIALGHLNPTFFTQLKKYGRHHEYYPSQTDINSRSYCVEFKFVRSMKRPYEFSVDSFQIDLDSIMMFHKLATFPMSSKFFPTVIGESFYGDFKEALSHLTNKVISIKQPKDVRGGGLLKYCTLILKGYKPLDPQFSVLLQEMCSKFYSDFPWPEDQRYRLTKYFENHLSGVHQKFRYSFLVVLHKAVSSARFSKSRDRITALKLIEGMAKEL